MPFNFPISEKNTDEDKIRIAHVRKTDVPKKSLKSSFSS